jgi:protein TonB
MWLVALVICSLVIDVAASSEAEEPPVDLTKPSQGECPSEQWGTERGCVTPPMLARRVEPKYPKSALKQRVSATIVLNATVSTSGTVESISVKSSTTPGLGFEQAAIDAVKQWRYRPALIARKKVSAIWTIVVTFSQDAASAP